MKKELTITDVKQALRSKIVKKYGGVSAFLQSKDGQKFGGMKIKPYLYDTGATSFEPLRDLAEFFGMGTLTRQVAITKKTVYYLSK